MIAAAVAAAEAAGPAPGENVRIDSWIWAVRLVKTRSMGATACRGGHVQVNGERVKPAHSVRVGDELVEDLVWTYPDPDDDARDVRDLLCFFNERVDLEVDGEPVERPQTQWSHA